MINEKEAGMSPRGKELNEQMRAGALAKISRAALEVFAEYGFHGATMRRIAHVSGLSYGLVYHYFPSKEKIFRRLVDFALEGSRRAMEAVVGGPGTAWERIEAYSAFVVGNIFEGETSLLFLVMLQAMTQGKGVPGLLDRIARKTEVYFELFAPLIALAQREGKAAPGDPVALAAAYFSFMQGLATLPFQRKGLEKKITPSMLANVLRNPEVRT
jgi:AcrR family transcriptional regulator